MNTTTIHDSVLERLHELEGWAEYITEALHLSRRGEPVSRVMLERVVDEPLLRQIRELSWSLRDKLHLVNVQLEHGHGGPPIVEPTQH